MDKVEVKTLKIGDIVEVSGPRNKNYGKIGIVRAITIAIGVTTSGIGDIYLEPYNCEFMVGIATPVLYTGVYLYGFTHHALSFKVDK